MNGFFAFIFALAVTPVFSAGSDDTTLLFSTKGPDRYADGTTVLDGECYALVWSKDGVFEGLSADGAPVDENDKVVIVAPVAKDGRCPDIVFQIDAVEAARNAGGRYAVYLLDTRVRTDETVRPSGAPGGKLRLLNGFGSVTADIVSRSSSVGALLTENVTGDKGQVAAVSAAAPKDRAQPKIKGLRIEGDNVYLTVENLGGYFRVQQGRDVSAADETGVATPADETDGDVILIAPKRGAAGFYKVIRN